ncbi:MAG: class II aldolase/adducin family protein [Deltaproteobacteria bacterium]|nr:class II aldolase/adducin family protein [Deltaproteobacteria bacterium]
MTLSAPAERRARDDIVRVMRRVWERGLLAAGDGNASVRLGPRRIAITPSGVLKAQLQPEQIVTIDERGRLLEGKVQPTSEIAMHLAVYRVRPDVQAVLHAHPPTAIALSLAGISLAQCILPEVVVALGAIPTATYATPGTLDVPASIEELIRGHNAVLLERHGTLTCGDDLEQAYGRLEVVEHTARITHLARQLGPIAPLTPDEVQRVQRAAESAGLIRAPADCSKCGVCRR